MKTVMVKVNNATQTIAEHTVVTKDGQPTVIKAVQKVNYELFDKATGRAPNHIVTKRMGNDLHVSMEDEGQESDLIIEGFYNNPDSALIGLAENGEYYYYIPDTGEIVDYVTELQIGDIEGQALGGDSQITPWWVGASNEGFNALPWLVGLAGVGIIGAALGGGSSSKDKDQGDTTAPDAPTINPNEVGEPITGTGEPGATVTVTYPDGTTAETTVDADGNWTVPTNDSVVDGTTITATQTDPAG
ncbi:Ig-like domain-containing protein, partial [Psychrobacter sanguinis]